MIWAGVVGSYEELLNNWRRRATTPPASLPTGARRWRQALVDRYGTPSENPKFWESISAHGFLNDISGPIQLHHGMADKSVPVDFSISLEKKLKDAGKIVELYTYLGDDHNFSSSFGTAMKRSVEFFDKYVKNTNSRQ